MLWEVNSERKVTVYSGIPYPVCMERNSNPNTYKDNSLRRNVNFGLFTLEERNWRYFDIA